MHNLQDVLSHLFPFEKRYSVKHVNNASVFEDGVKK